MKNRVVVAMSGGVDSSVAAALLQEQGYEVIGITMCFSAAGVSAYGGNLSEFEPKKPRCCGLQGIEDARRVCHKLGIKHYVLNMQKILEDKVIKDFCLEYSRGRTPNPCIKCNQYVKFDALLKKALSLGAKYLATGHYARVSQLRKEFFLQKAKDPKKDQTYFIYRLGQKQLKHLLFPLGGYTKDEVRDLARKFDLAVAEKKESQEICFLPGDDYRNFLKSRLGFAPAFKPGLVVDKQGKILGQHQGVAFYTIGQRQGLGIAAKHPLYVVKIDFKNNRLLVGTQEEAHSSEFLLKNPHYTIKPIKKKVVLGVKIRYNSQEARAEVLPVKNKLKIKFKTPQFAITAGQSAVFYKNDHVIGGGIIEKVLN